MTRIQVGSKSVTLINVFTVQPERQQQLLDLLVEATNAVIRSQPGFISANLHRSLDGRQVTNYAQWRSREDYEAMLRDPVAQTHMRAAAAMADGFAPNLYEVAFVESNDEV